MNEQIEPIFIGQVDDIDIDSVENFEHEGIDYAIYRFSHGFFATQGFCPCDQNSIMSEGNLENEEIECPSCNKIYSIVSGDCVSNPELDRLKIFDVTIEKDNLYLNI
tara:strand:- start:483 stop:803 length:321 start_codon:yes stop_codon:yes gene_type:complete